MLGQAVGPAEVNAPQLKMFKDALILPDCVNASVTYNGRFARDYHVSFTFFLVEAAASRAPQGRSNEAATLTAARSSSKKKAGVPSKFF